MSPGEENQACLRATAGHAPAVCSQEIDGPRTLLWLALCLTRGRPGQNCPEERAQEDGGPLVPPRGCGQRRGAGDPSRAVATRPTSKDAFPREPRLPLARVIKKEHFLVISKLCWSALMAGLLEKQNLLSAHLFLFGSLLNFPMETPPCPMEEGRQD